MAFLAFAAAALFTLALWLISGHYRRRLAGRERVVMNWSFDGKPTTYASPRLALAITPVIGTVSLFFVAGLVAFATPVDERAAALVVIPLCGLVVVAIHGAHLHFAARHNDT